MMMMMVITAEHFGNGSYLHCSLCICMNSLKLYKSPIISQGPQTVGYLLKTVQLISSRARSNR